MVMNASWNVFDISPEESPSEQAAWVPKLTNNCEADVSNIKRQSRRQLQIPSPEERHSEQPRLLSNCEAELEEVSGHEREQRETRRQLLILGPLRQHFRAMERLAATVLMFLPRSSQIESPVQHHNTYFSTLLPWRLSPVQHRRAYHTL